VFFIFFQVKKAVKEQVKTRHVSLGTKARASEAMERQQRQQSVEIHLEPM